MKGLYNKLTLVLGLALAASLAFGCAEERPAIDRVQPYALDKTFFVGEDLVDPADNPEFWTQGTLVDVGYGASQDGLFTSTYAQPMSRMKWEITEDYLIGRLSYERIDDSDGKGIGDEIVDGVIVAVFEIKDHFDIVKAYNPTTGEELNILEENSTDRPWYERKYMRVDWSENLNTDSYDFDTLSLLGIYGGVEYESLAYYVDDPRHEDAPYFDYEGGYFDITSKAFAKPGVVDLSHLGWGIDSFPACFLDNDFMGGSAPSGSCSPVELTIRQSFRKVEDLDYEPRDWDGLRFQAYGGFYVERYGFERNYGMSDQKWRRFLARYPIWERSHYYKNADVMTGSVPCFTEGTTPPGKDPHRDDNGDGTEDECASAGGGSRCDEFRQMCTLPYQQRKQQTVAWYYTEKSDPEFFEASALATHDWDVALRTAVRTAKYTECVKIGGADCKTKYPMYVGQEDDNVDAVALALEVDDCRNGIAYKDKKGDKAACEALADTIGAKRGYSDGVISIAKMDEMIVLCHSPVLFGDPPACGARRLLEGMTQADCGTLEDTASVEGDNAVDAAALTACRDALRVRRGDLRYHQVNVIEEPQTPSPWGIYTDAEDPLTGMTVSAAINVWSYVNNLWSQKVIDQLRYIAGELETEDVTEGQYVKDWTRAAMAASRDGMLPKLTRAERDRRLSELTRGYAVEDLGANYKVLAEAHPEVIDAVRKLKQEFSGVRASLDAPSTMAPIYQARRKAAEGSPVEAQLMNKMIQQLHGVEGMAMSDGLLDLVSPLRGGNPSFQRQINQMKENALGEKGRCVLYEAEAPMDLVGLTDVLEAKFGKFNPKDSTEDQWVRAERMRRYLAARAHQSVIVHEMGHSIGMRHNFVSSSDAWNYRPQYWQLRTKNGTVTNVCEDLDPDGEGCVGPRYFDPVTEGESANLIRMFMTSSVMEYAGETTQDFMGLGAYDFATARMFYGDAVAVHADPSYNLGTPRANTVFSKMDNFGGILGISHSYGGNDIHYSELQSSLQLIKDCTVVDPQDFVPGRYDPEFSGTFHPVLDGLIVSVNGQHTRCRQQEVDYVNWTELRIPEEEEFGGYYRGGGGVDALGRTRVPYGFATDRWADLGNLSVYRHDNGADAYEIFDFLITQQEVNHIFDNYRRGRQNFSVRSAAARTQGRYNEKVRDGAKGLTLMRNIYSQFSLELGYDFDTFWPDVAPFWFPENILASGMVFDHFTRMAARPEIGPHFRQENNPVLLSSVDTIAEAGETQVVIPNGATGKFGDISAGGKLIENRLAEGMGEYDSELTINAGSYYDKISVAMLMTESVDNYISDSREDFVDARYRATSLADLFPDGYRRFLANALTDDEFLKGPRVASNASGKPLVDGEGYPSSAIGWTSWWGEEPTACFPSDGSTVCGIYGNVAAAAYGGGQGPANVTVIDPQLGWEIQKFYIAWTLLYLPENQQQNWLDMMRIWELGKDADPGFEGRIEFHWPYGKVYVAKTFGRETIFGKEVERGIAARVLEYANDLMVKAFQTTDGPDINGDGAPDWYLPVLNPDTGEPIVLWDKSIAGIQDGYVYPNGTEECNADYDGGCTCSSNRACTELKSYIEVPFFLRQTLDAYGLMAPQQKGIYD
ncbi:MAG: hypothetical protein ABIK09_04460 [Pseudomonadota bacterium]